MSAEEDDLEDAFVPILDEQGSVRGAMDRTTAEFFASKQPEPSQAALDAVLSRATRVRFLGERQEGRTIHVDRPLIDTSDPAALATLRACMRIKGGPFGHLMAFPTEAFEFFAPDQFLARIEFLGAALRWDAWKGDAHLTEPGLVYDWFASQGRPELKSAYIACSARSRDREEQAQREWDRWFEAMPASVRPLWDDRMDGITLNAAPLERTLATEFPDPSRRALALFRWYGSGAGPWNGYPARESVPERLLLRTPTPELVAALANHQPSATELSGAARYFSGWSFRKEKPEDATQLPPDVTVRLLAHVLEHDPNEGNREVARQRLRPATADPSMVLDYRSADPNARRWQRGALPIVLSMVCWWLTAVTVFWIWREDPPLSFTLDRRRLPHFLAIGGPTLLAIGCTAALVRRRLRRRRRFILYSSIVALALAVVARVLQMR